MEKNLSYIKIGLVALSALMVFLFALEAISIEFLIYFALVILGLIVNVTFFASLLNFAENPSTGKNFLIGIVGLLVIFGISYAISSDTIDSESEQIIAGSKIAEAGIYTLYTLVVLAVGALLYSSVKRIFS